MTKRKWYSKKFNGKMYTFKTGKTTKSDAHKEAKRLRQKGFLARVIQVTAHKDVKGRRIKYEVWVRKK